MIDSFSFFKGIDTLAFFGNHEDLVKLEKRNLKVLEWHRED